MVKDGFSSIQEDILRIAKANSARNYWAVLDIPPGSDYKHIKTAHRKWLRRLHPDRWFATADPQLYKEVQEAFYEVQLAYFETLKLYASHESASSQPDPIPMSSPESSSVETPFWGRLPRFLQKLFSIFVGERVDGGRRVRQ